MRTFCSCVPRGMVHALLETARSHLRAAAPSLAFLPVETARGELYAPMERCRSGHWWTPGAPCETCAKIDMDVRDQADDRWLAERLEVESDAEA